MVRLIRSRRLLVTSLAVLFAVTALLSLAGGPVMAAGTGSVFINKHVCPAGFDTTHASYSRLARVCNDDGNGFGFTLITGGHSFRQMTGHVQPHAVTWDGMPAHIFTIQEKVPGGFGTPIVFCKGNNGSNTFERMIIYSGNQIRPTLTDGGLLYCDWFNVRTT